MIINYHWFPIINIIIIINMYLKTHHVIWNPPLKPNFVSINHPNAQNENHANCNNTYIILHRL